MNQIDVSKIEDDNETLISVVVCTRNRGKSIAETIESLLTSDAKSFEIVIIDQSTNSETRFAVEPFLDDKRVHYYATDTKGLGLARNLGLAHSYGEVVCMTDDDCVVPSDWLSKMALVFRDYPETAVVFCNVEAGSHNPDFGFIPAYVTHKTRVMKSVIHWCADHGIGAGMAVSRRAMNALGGFDSMLGAGAVYPSQEDADISLRALLRGYTVVQSASTSVVHNGFRTWQQGRDLGKRDCVGVGAGYAKLIRCGEPLILFVWLFELYHFLIQPAFWYLVRFRKPPVIRRAISLFEGFKLGWKADVDKKNMRFSDEEVLVSKVAV